MENKIYFIEKSKLAQEEFIQKAKLVHGDKYYYSKSKVNSCRL